MCKEYLKTVKEVDDFLDFLEVAFFIINVEIRKFLNGYVQALMFNCTVDEFIDKKIEKFLKANKNYFANIDSDSVLLNELGHKYHYYLSGKISKSKDISYNKAKE